MLSQPFLPPLSLDVPFSWHLFLLASLLFSTLLFSALDPSVFLCISLYFFNLCSAEISLSLLWQWTNWTNWTKKLWKGWISSIQGMATCSNILHHLASSGGSHGRDSPQVPSLVMCKLKPVIYLSCLVMFLPWITNWTPLFYLFSHLPGFWKLCLVDWLTQLSALMCWWLEAEISAQNLVDITACNQTWVTQTFQIQRMHAQCQNLKIRHPANIINFQPVSSTNSTSFHL